MGLFDFFFRPPSQDQFAKLFIDALRRAGISEPLSYDQANGRIVIGDAQSGQSIFVVNFYREYLSLPRSARKQHLADRAKMLAARDVECPDDFETARENLRPKLWVRSALEKMRLRVQLDGGDLTRFNPPEYEVGSHLVASLVYDLPDKMVSINSEQLDKWGITYYEALEVARENLEQAPSSFAQIGDGFYAAMTGDNYDACRLLLPSLIERLEVNGDLIAMVPNRDSLLVCGSDDSQGLEIMLDLTAKALEEPRPMVPIPLRWDDGQWVDWQPPADHSLAARFKELAVRFLAQEYDDQKSLIEELDRREQRVRTIADYQLASRGDEEMLFSFATWSRSVPCLLPETDMLKFETEPNAQPIWLPWSRVWLELGDVFRPVDFYPRRYEVSEFPSDVLLKRMASGG